MAKVKYHKGIQVLGWKDTDYIWEGYSPMCNQEVIDTLNKLDAENKILRKRVIKLEKSARDHEACYSEFKPKLNGTRCEPKQLN